MICVSQPDSNFRSRH